MTMTWWEFVQAMWQGFWPYGLILVALGGIGLLLVVSDIIRWVKNHVSHKPYYKI